MSRRSSDDTQTIRGILKRETDKAVLIQQGDTEGWLPKSQISIDDSASPGDEVDVIVPEWLIEQHGFF